MFKAKGNMFAMEIRKYLVLFATVALALFGDQLAFAGAWTQENQGYYFKLSSHFVQAKHDYDEVGNRILKAGSGQLTEFDIRGYLEYGIRNGLTLVVSAPYSRLYDVRTFSNGIARERRSGFGDFEIRLKKRLYKGNRIVISAAGGGKVPLWYQDDPDTRVPLSSKNSDQDMRLLAGVSLYHYGVYITSELGYRKRGGVFSDELFFSFEAGLTVGRFLVKGYLAGIQSRGVCDVTSGEVNLIGDQDILKLSPGVIYRLKEGIELSLELNHTAAGCNTSAGSQYSVGIAFKR